MVFRNFSKTDFIRHLIAALFHRDFQPELNHHHHPKLSTFTARRVRVYVSDRRPWPVHARRPAAWQDPGCVSIAFRGAPEGVTAPLREYVPGRGEAYFSSHHTFFSYLSPINGYLKRLPRSTISAAKRP